MASPILGQGDISDLVIFAVARTMNVGGDGVLVAFDRETGEIVWETILPYYMWSSPVAVYTPEGQSYIVLFDSMGNMFLIRGTTGEIMYQTSVWVNVEASPAVFGNRVIIGTRGSRIFAIDIL
jgi:outer membrane protein assembly factor BamB